MLESDSFGLVEGFWLLLLFFSPFFFLKLPCTLGSLLAGLLFGGSLGHGAGGYHLLERSTVSSVALLKACSGG